MKLSGYLSPSISGRQKGIFGTGDYKLFTLLLNLRLKYMHVHRYYVIKDPLEDSYGICSI